MYGDIPDNYDLWEAHERRMEERLARLPKCMNCGEHIQQETAIYLDWARKWICDECAENRREVEED